MEVDQIQCKFQRFDDGNGRLGSLKLGQNQHMDEQYPDEEEDGEREAVRAKNGGRGEAGVDLGGGVGRFHGWPSSRIVRVTRASGGKDRHSKVLTSKGLRDRRVRLSVHTAIQFYDLQDRLGYDQPSKAVEWLLRAAASSISELPPMSIPFPDTVSDEKRSSTGGSDQIGFDTGDTETSKGSGLLISRSENRIKARERAKERAAEKKEKDQNEPSSHVPSLNPVSQTTSFTELLNGGFSRSVSTNAGDGDVNESISPMDYFTNGLSGHPATRLGQMQFVNSLKQNELQFEFAPDNLVSVGGNGSNNHHNGGGGSSAYSLNFAISSANSSGFAGFNRGTLQSNSSPPSLLSPVLRFPPTDGSPGNFLIGATVPGESHHQFLSGFDARLQLYYGDAHSNDGTLKGRGKN